MLCFVFPFLEAKFIQSMKVNDDIKSKCILVTSSSKCKGPEAGVYLGCSRNAKANVAKVSEGEWLRKGVQQGCRECVGLCRPL